MQEPSRASRVYLLLKEAIESGEYPVGAALPSQAELARRLGTSMGTLRKALERLAREGLVEARHGSGTYVMAQRAERGRVLVVDDDPTVCEAMRDFVTSLGYQVDVATSGEEALAQVLGRRYSHVLMDVRLAGMSGLTAARRIRKVDPSVVLVFVTGHPTDVLVDQEPGIWPALLLRKPFDLEELERALSLRVSDRPSGPV